MASITRIERSVKLIRAIERAEGGEIGAGVVDLRIFESIIGNTANGRPRSTGLDRSLRGETDRPSFRPLPHSTASPPFVGDPINSGPHRRCVLGEKTRRGHSRITLTGDTIDSDDVALSIASALAISRFIDLK